MTTPGPVRVRTGAPPAAPSLDGIAVVLFDLDETRIGSRTAWLGRILALPHRQRHAQDDHRVAAARSTPRSRLSVLANCPLRVVAWGEDRLRRRVTLTPEARSVLFALEQAGLPYGVVTNGSTRKRHTLRLLGLEDRAAVTVIFGERGRRKPDVAMFTQTAADLGVRPGAVLFVGDKRRHSHGRSTAQAACDMQRSP